MTWQKAIRDTPAKSYRRTLTGRYEAYCSDRGRYVYLGTHDTPEEAEAASYEYKANRLIARVEEYGLYIEDGVVFMDNYIAFPNGCIFNLSGEPMRCCVNRDGYTQCVFNGKTISIHRIIASIFCEREIGKDFVNHIDGNKRNNSADNLEWCTKSENTLHSYTTGLQTRVGDSPVFTMEEKQYIKEHCWDNHINVALYLNRNSETVRKYMYRYRKETDE